MSDTLEVFVDEQGGYRWRRKAANGEIISTGEGYTRPDDARDGALRANPDLTPEDISE